MKLADIGMTQSLDQAQKAYPTIPSRLLVSLYNFVNNGQQPGHFLMGVLSNDLFQAISHADSDSIKCLPQIVAFVHSRIPLICYTIQNQPSKRAITYWIHCHQTQAEDIDPASFNSG